MPSDDSRGDGRDDDRGDSPGEQSWEEIVRRRLGEAGDVGKASGVDGGREADEADEAGDEIGPFPVPARPGLPGSGRRGSVRLSALTPPEQPSRAALTPGRPVARAPHPRRPATGNPAGFRRAPPDPSVSRVPSWLGGPELAPPATGAGANDPFAPAGTGAAPGAGAEPVESELGERLIASEAARRTAETRLAELEREIVRLRAELRSELAASEASPHAAGPEGEPGEPGEIERLRRELAEAHAIIRAIEDAYLEGSGGGDGAPNG